MNKLTQLSLCCFIFLIITNSGCTKNDPASPVFSTITTTTPHSITLTSAISGGIISSNGGDSVTERGICLNTLPNPTIQNQKIISGSGNGSFNCTITNLLPNITYYIRAYATNTAGTSYGNQEIIQTNSTGLLYKVVDSLSPAVYDTLEYNSENKLIKFRATRGGGSPNNGYVDTFIYSNNYLVRSQYNLGAVLNFGSPYSKSEYQYFTNYLVSSKYYLGNTNLITSSVYSFDNAGKLIQVTQTQINGSVGAYSTYTTRFEYDANSNLSKVFYKSGSSTEYMRKEYLNYDNKDNPFYNLPWTFDYNIFEENADKLSKNNVGTVNTYTASSLNGTVVYRYEYNFDGKVSKRNIVSNGTSSNAKYFLYRYQ